MTALVQLLICSIVWELHTSNVSGKRLPSATHTCNYIALPWVWPPSHYTENLIAKLSLSPISDSSLLFPRDGSIVRKEAECKKFSLPEIYPRNCPARRGGRRMSESGTKKGRRLACANDSAGGPNGLKAMWKWRKEGRELPPPRGPLLQLSSLVPLSPDWHCENIHPGRYSVAGNGSKQRALKGRY